MNKIAIYTGTGAYMAKDVENILASHNFDYNRLHENDIKQDKLNNYDILIIGGGAIFDIIPALSKEAIQKIKDFVLKGGKYIGICAGAYIASSVFTDNEEKEYRGIGLVETKFKRGKGEKIVEVLFHNCGQKIKLFYCNGPLIEKIGKDEELIASDKTNKIGIIRKDIGKGKVFLFCAHPEGNLFNKITAEQLGSDLFFIKLLKNK